MLQRCTQRIPGHSCEGASAAAAHSVPHLALHGYTPGCCRRLPPPLQLQQHERSQLHQCLACVLYEGVTQPARMESSTLQCGSCSAGRVLEREVQIEMCGPNFARRHAKRPWPNPACKPPPHFVHAMCHGAAAAHGAVACGWMNNRGPRDCKSQMFQTSERRICGLWCLVR